MILTRDSVPSEKEQEAYKKFQMMLENLGKWGKWPADIKIDHNSCRDANEPYNPDTTFTVLADGFIVSDNITVVRYESVDLQYAYSDHDPVIMEFCLQE